MWYDNRRVFLKTAGAAVAGMGLAARAAESLPTAPSNGLGQELGVQVLNPQNRVPLSFIIDDSTCLVNMGYYCMPQFAAAWPDRDIYKKPWQTWPREIPDDFVREFGQWCAEHGVRGKYSIVPYPACVGWLDRELPGWSRQQLRDSLELVRQLMVPSWDIHPEMITHTRVMDLATGRPLAEMNSATMENSYPQTHKSVDELAAYLAYALRILKNCDLPCEGITTPGGFGNGVESGLSLAVQQAVRDVYGAELPHYFKFAAEGTESTEPKLEHVSGLDTGDLRLTVNIPASTGDWFGGWDGDERPQGHLYANEDATAGRMVELIQRGQPALMLCHWAGMYTQGTKSGFEAFKKVILALEGRFAEQTLWMKLSEIARYWTAKQLARIQPSQNGVTVDSPVASPRFTLRITGPTSGVPRLVTPAAPVNLQAATRASQLAPGTWLRDEQGLIVCFDLPKGRSTVSV